MLLGLVKVQQGAD